MSPFVLKELIDLSEEPMNLPAHGRNFPPVPASLPPTPAQRKAPLLVHSHYLTISMEWELGLFPVVLSCLAQVAQEHGLHWCSSNVIILRRRSKWVVRLNVSARGPERWMTHHELACPEKDTNSKVVDTPKSMHHIKCHKRNKWGTGREGIDDLGYFPSKAKTKVSWETK